MNGIIRINVQEIAPATLTRPGAWSNLDWRSGMSILTKKCNVCDTEKPRTDFYMRGKWIDYRCKECSKRAAKEWVEKNPDRRKKIANKYAQAHPEKPRAWEAKHPEKMKASREKWRLGNYMRWITAKWKWNADNRERRLETTKQWKSKNKDKVRTYDNNRRARELGSDERYTSQEWQALKKFHNYTCLRCGRKEPEILLTPDHVRPLAKGGANGIENIQPLCLDCNMWKSTKEIDYR